MTAVRNQKRLIAALGLGSVLWLGRSEAVVLDTFTFVQDASGTVSDNVVCILSTPANQDPPVDIFGTPVNLADAGPVLCLTETTGGVVQSAHCESVVSGAWASDLPPATIVCVDPPACTQTSVVAQSLPNVSGTIPAAIAANLPAGHSVTYTYDALSGPQTLVPGPSPIPGCPTLGPGYGHTEGQGALNVFLVQPTETGTDVTTTSSPTFFNPITQEETPVTVNMSFAGVTEAGSTTVTASSSDTGTLPPNFTIAAAGFQAAFLYISTTATVTPPITICTDYADADADGFVDGTALSESVLGLLHGEGDPVVFVDRTSSRDPVANRICGEVSSLSPFVLAAQTAVSACGDVPRSGCRTAAKSQLNIAHDPTGDPKKDALSWKWSNGPATSQGELGDPTADTETALCVFDANRRVLEAVVPGGVTCGTLAKPKPCWAAIKTTGYQFKDNLGTHAGITAIALKANGTAPKSKVQVKGKGSNLPDPILTLTEPVTVQLVTDHEGGACFEATYGSGTGQVLLNGSTKFKAKAP